jgi:hypothetical protein
MKKTLLIAGAIASMALSARAIPTLQLDAAPATYDPVSETTISTTPTFTLYALLNGLTPTPGDTYAVVASLEPAQLSPASLGSFVFNGTTVPVTSGMTLGNPGLPPHGVYPTYYRSFAFSWNPANRFNNYDVSLVGGTHTGPTPNALGNSLYMAFNVDITGLAAGHTLWFDLVEYNAAGQVVQFAPFSHAAQGGRLSVPDGGSTAILLGFAMLGLGWARRKVFC